MEGSGDGVRPTKDEYSDDESKDSVIPLSTDAIDAVVKVKSLSISDTEEQFRDLDDPSTDNEAHRELVETDAHEVKPETRESSSSGEKEGRSSSRNRCYRNRQLEHTSDEENSNDADGAASSNPLNKPRPRSTSSEGKRTANTGDDVRLPKYRRHEDESDTEREDATIANLELLERVASNLSDGDGADDIIGNGNNGSDGDNSEHGEVDDEGDDSSGIENVLLEPYGSSDSSSSSETSLDDLEDQTAIGIGKKSESNSCSEDPKKTDEGRKSRKALPKALCKTKPKDSWNGVKAMLRQEIGMSLRSHRPAKLPEDFYGSLFSAERLELMSKLEGHQGCVNCLNFNSSGTRLCSGSDDLDIRIWDYNRGKCDISFPSGHKANVFQARFMPFPGLDNLIVSASRDNQIRLNELSSSGEVRSSRKLAQHKGPCHKLSLSADNPHTILSCGEDSFVFSIDIREEKPSRVLSVREKGRRVGLYSIHQNPFQPHEFCLSGKDSFVRIYDLRKLPSASFPVPQDSLSSSSSEAGNAGAASIRVPPVKKFCPHHLVGAGGNHQMQRTNVTAAVYNYNGKEVLASYNDEHIYLFDSSHSDGADFVKRYEGHRNNATVKGVNFFGSRSEFVISGSDDGHIFLWEKNSECIVNFLRADNNGVVNCLEGHPKFPILATSGLDEDIKIFVPSKSQHETKMPDNLLSTVRRNYKKREQESRIGDEPNGFVMWAFFDRMHRRSRRERRDRESHSDSWEDDDEEDDEDDAGADCVIA